MNIWEPYSTFLIFVFANAFSGYFIAYAAWIPKLRLLYRLPIWVFLVQVFSLVMWCVAGVAIYAVKARLDAYIATSSETTFNLFLDMALTGAFTGVGTFAGIIAWILVMGIRTLRRDDAAADRSQAPPI